MRIHHVDNRSELVLEDALTPLLVATWIGPATLGLVTKFRRWGEEQVALARANKTPIVLISDASRAGRPPAEVRRALADIQFDARILVKSYVVLTNPLVRGAMTAIGWIAGGEFLNTCCDTLPDALDQANAYVRSCGVRGPSNAEFTRYWARAPARASG